MARPKTPSPSSLKLKTCKKYVRDGGAQVQCNKQYLGEDRNCPNHGHHLLRLKTGFCSNGWHEGSKATDWKGKPVPTCKFIETCPCKCHDDLGKLFEITGAERIVVESSGYVTPPSEFVYGKLNDDDPSLNPGPSDGPTGTGEAVVAPIPPPVARSYEPTPSGRAAPGQLEVWVLTQTDIWTVEGFEFPCTPVWISKNIAHDEAIPPPSVGAINAVFNRWVALGFATIERSPVRFTGYTEEGKRLGLEKMKEQVKRQAALRKAEQRRGIR